MTSNVAVVIRFQCQTNYNATNVRIHAISKVRITKILLSTESTFVYTQSVIIMQMQSR